MRAKTIQSVAVRFTLLLTALGVPAPTLALSGDIYDLDADMPHATNATPALLDSPAVPAAVVPAPVIPASVVPAPVAVGFSEQPAALTERAPSANPLWAVPLTRLSNTRERPIFSPSRRPPPPPDAPTAQVQRAPPPRPARVERPQLLLVGTISSDNQGFGIFIDQSSKAAMRLRIGEDYQGWKLRSVQGREATLERDQQTAVLSLPPPAAAAAVPLPLQAENVMTAAPVDMPPRGSPRH